MPRSATPFLMFQGAAEEALQFYGQVFPGSRVIEIEHWADGEPGPSGQFKGAVYELAGQRFSVFESPVAHAFDFTPSFSIFVECEDLEELERVYALLLDGGQALMELGDHGFSRRFGWVNDRFGVSWQLNLA